MPSQPIATLPCCEAGRCRNGGSTPRAVLVEARDRVAEPHRVLAQPLARRRRAAPCAGRRDGSRAAASRSRRSGRAGPDDGLAVAAVVGERRASRWRARRAPSARPSSLSSRMACGSRLMPTPSGRTSGAASNTRAEMPAWWQAERQGQAADAAADDQHIGRGADALTRAGSRGLATTSAQRLRSRTTISPSAAGVEVVGTRPCASNTVLASGAAEDRRDLLVQPLDDVGRRALGGEQAVPHVDIDAVQAGSRSASARRAAAAGARGCRRRSPSACRRGCAGPRRGPAGTCSRSGRPAGPAPRPPCPCRARAAARCPLAVLDQRHRQMMRRADARAAVGQRLGLRLRRRDQLGQRVGRLAGIGDQHQRAPGGEADRREVGHRVVGQVLVTGWRS